MKEANTITGPVQDESRLEVDVISTSTNSAPAAPGPHSLRSLRAETEIHAISQALAQTGWNRKRAAQLLSISYRGLLYKIRQHNITPPATSGFSELAE